MFILFIKKQKIFFCKKFGDRKFVYFSYVYFIVFGLCSVCSVFDLQNDRHFVCANISENGNKDEVKEFELYNIKIQKYKDLVIDNKLNFIEELEDF